LIKTAVFYIAFLIVMTLVKFTGYSQDKILSDTEWAAVLVVSEAATDNVFAGLTANDHAVFSRDFDSYMKMRISATSFPGWRQDLNDQHGTYQSR